MAKTQNPNLPKRFFVFQTQRKDKIINKIQAVILATLSIMIFSCNKTTCESTPIIGNCCVDSSLISDSASCFAVYDPVLGVMV